MCGRTPSSTPGSTQVRPTSRRVGAASRAEGSGPQSSPGLSEAFSLGLGFPSYNERAEEKGEERGRGR